ncbi:MAG: LCP family protein [Erysipelotrichaceae bacterium]
MKKNTKNKTKKTKRWNLGFILPSVQLVLSLVFLGMVLYLQVLPMWLFAVVAIATLGINALLYWILASKKTNKFNSVMGKVLSVIISICLIVGNVVVYQGISTLGSITGSNYKTDNLSVIVLKDASAESISDLKTSVFGIQQTSDLENTQHAIEAIEKKVKQSITTTPFDSYSAQVDALYNGSVDSIIINEAFRALIEDQHPEFSNETRVVYQVARKTEATTQTNRKVDVTKDAFNVYISGGDYYGAITSTSRSDVNMVVSINPTTKEILLTNIPRDYFVPLACQNGAMDKLTHAGIYGPACSMNTLENVMGIEIDYYGRMNFSSLINIVNALGGVDVYSQYAFSAGGYTFNVGNNYMDGEKALAFSRERYSLPGGDRDRGVNQQAVIQGIIKKAISPAIIKNYSSLMNALSGSFETNMKSSDITKLIQMQLSDMAAWNITTANLDGTGSSQPTYSYGSQPLYVMIPNQATIDEAKTLIDRLFAGEALN